MKTLAAFGCGALARIALADDTKGRPSSGKTIAMGLPFFTSR